MALKINVLHGKGEKKIKSKNVMNNHSLFVVALIKERFGQFREYVRSSKHSKRIDPIFI
jgi:hypothetical protein